MRRQGRGVDEGATPSPVVSERAHSRLEGSRPKVESSGELRIVDDLSFALESPGRSNEESAAWSGSASANWESAWQSVRKQR